MTTLKVGQMHCEMCVKRITKAFEEAGISFDISLEDKTVKVDGDDNSVNRAIEELDDLGFDEVEKV